MDTDLMRFTGVAGYYRPQPIENPKLLLSEGAWFLAEKADAFWLIEKIVILQEDRKLKSFFHYDEDQCWRLEVIDDHTSILSTNMHRGRLVYTEEIKHDTLPFKRVELCLQPQVLIQHLGFVQVCSLMSEM